MLEEIISENFILDSHGKDYGYISDYELDSQKEHDGISVWIEIANARESAMKEINKDYKKFAAPFEAWAKSKGLYDPEILTDDKSNSITYKVTVY